MRAYPPSWTILICVCTPTLYIMTIVSVPSLPCIASSNSNMFCSDRWRHTMLCQLSVVVACVLSSWCCLWRPPAHPRHAPLDLVLQSSYGVRCFLLFFQNDPGPLPLEDLRGPLLRDLPPSSRLCLCPMLISTASNAVLKERHSSPQEANGSSRAYRAICTTMR